MEINKIFKIYALPNLFISSETFDDYKYESSSIDKIIKKLKKDKGYNIRINPDEPSIVYGDFDKTTLEQFLEFLNDLCLYFGIQIDEISYSSSKNNTSFHFSIPSIETNPKNLKNIFKKKAFDKYREHLDLSVYSKHWFRLPEQTLQGKPEPHIIIKGKIEDFIINYTDNASAELQDEEPDIKQENKEKATIEYNENKTHKEYIEKLVELLNDSRADDRDEWKDISFIINNELGDEGLELFQTFSKRSKKYDPIKDDKWYLNLRKNDSGLFIGSLINFVKEDNLERYEQLRKEYINSNSIKSTFTLLEKDIAEYIINKLSNNSFINTMPKPGLDFYYFNGNIWERDKGTRNLLKIIYSDLINEYEQYITKTAKEAEKLKKQEKDNHLKSSVKAQQIVKKLKGKLCYINSIIEWIGILTYNPMFFDTIDENPDLIAFTNGTYELNTKIFRKSKKKDYITKTVGYDFPEH